MEQAKVYFTDFRTTLEENLLQKLARLMATAGMDRINFEGKYVAIKMHFGEPGNLAFLRPNYARAVVDFIKDLGGRPFLTDCNTLYVGGRKNALDHLDSANLNGFTPLTTGCQILIADGLKGTDEVRVPIPGGEYLQEAILGRALVDADIVISLTHFKGHENTAFGGALKNLGMGCGSTRGKAEMHDSERPQCDEKTCVACGVCAENCAHGAIRIDGRALVDYDKCKGCGRCIGVCPTKAMKPGEENGCEIMSRKVTEYAWAVCKDRPNFHINLLIDVSPFCDCYGHNDAPVIPDVGMFASFDPVAIDKACADAANREHAVLDSFLGDKHPAEGADHFHTMHPDTKWEAGIEQGEKIGLGSAKYELVTMK